METRTITVNELHYVKFMFNIDSRIEKKSFTSEQIDRFILHLKYGMEKNTTLIVMSFIDDEPIQMYVTYLFEKVATAYIGLVKTIKTAVHFKTSAKMLAPAFDLLTEILQESGYYKVLMTASERNHNIRNLIMCQCSKHLGNYDWYDEVVVPKGDRAGVYIYDINRLSVNTESSLVVRMFVLKQEYRIPLLKKLNLTYLGTTYAG